MERDESGEKDRELGRELSRGAEEKRAAQEGREPKSPEPKAPRQSFTLSVLIPALVATALWLLFSILGDESAKVGGELTAVKNLYDETAARVSNLESRVKELGDKNAVVANGGTAPKPVPIPSLSPATKPADQKDGGKDKASATVTPPAVTDSPKKFRAYLPRRSSASDKQSTDPK